MVGLLPLRVRVVPLHARVGSTSCPGWSHLVLGLVPPRARVGPTSCSGWSHLVLGLVPLRAQVSSTSWLSYSHFVLGLPPLRDRVLPFRVRIAPIPRVRRSARASGGPNKSLQLTPSRLALLSHDRFFFPSTSLQSLYARSG